MTPNLFIFFLLSIVLSISACGHSSDSTQAPSNVGTSSTTGANAETADSGINITVITQPDPPQAGNNALDVVVTNPDGSPITDATVAATYYMPAMPSMNMPEMRSQFSFENTGNGHYRGKGELEMSGTWNVTVRVARNGEQIASKKLSVIAK